MSEPTMPAVVIRAPGGPEVLELREVPRPRPSPSELLVRVDAAALNRADLLQRRGRYPAPRGWPQEIPGLEYAGVVADVGSGVSRFQAGDAVMGLVGGGGYARYVVVHEREAVRVPDGVEAIAAAAIPEAFMTAFDAVWVQMDARVGETLLIHAVGSGVGTAALQLGRVAGVATIGTSRTPEKLRRALELGLDVAVEAGEGAWADEVLRATRGRGVDVVLGLVGGPYLEQNLRVLAPRGRMVVVGVTAGPDAAIDLRALMGRRASITGTVLRARPLEEKIALARSFEARVVRLFETGELAPVVDRVFPAAEAAEAHRFMEADANFGKIVLDWS